MAIVVLFFVFTGIYTDFLWFDSVHYTSVFSTMLWTQVSLFALGAVLMVGIVGGNMLLGHRVRPMFGIGMFSGAQGADRYRLAIDPHRKLIFLVVMGILALFAGSSTAGQWRTWLLFFNRTPFGQQDPQFHMDVSFFMFTYPFIRMGLNFLFTAVILSGSAFSRRAECTPPGPPAPICLRCSACSCCSSRWPTGWIGTASPSPTAASSTARRTPT